MREPTAPPLDENLYKTLVDRLPDLVFVLDREGDFLAVHGDTYGVLGYTREQMRQMNFRRLSAPPGSDSAAPPAEHPFLRQFRDPACGQRTVSEFELTARTRDGETRHLELNAAGLYGDDGQLTSIYVVARDISFRKRLLSRVEYFRQLNQQILHSLHEGIVVLEVPELRIVNANRSFLTAVRLQESQLVGCTCSEILERYRRPELFGELPRLLQRTLETGRASRREYVASDLSAHRVHLELLFQPIVSGAGNASQVMMMMRDITRRKRFETEMRRRVRKLSFLNEVSESLQSTSQQLEEVLQCVLVGVTAGKGMGFNRAFILLNDEAQEVLEGRLAVGPADPEEAGRIWSALDRRPLTFAELLKLHLESPGAGDARISQLCRELRIPLDKSDHILVRAMREKRAFNVVASQVRGDTGLVVDPELVAFLGNDSFVVLPLYTTQRPIGVLVADNFITRRAVLFEDLEFLKILNHHASYAIENARLYEELELKVQELEGANRKLQQNQVALIEAERLSTIGKMAASVAHEIRNPLVTIGGYARLLLKDISTEDPRWEDLNVIATEVSRLEFIVNEVLGYARYTEPNLDTGDLNQLVKTVVQTFRAQWAADHLCLDLDLQAGLPAVRMDQNQIKQVLLNLILNAVQANPEGGRVLVSTRTANGRVELTVADTGSGIPEHIRDKVFTPFFTTKSSGTGLGLNIAAQIIAAHGGDIDFESHEGRGTTFWIALPRAEEEKTS